MASPPAPATAPRSAGAPAAPAAPVDHVFAALDVAGLVLLGLAVGLGYDRVFTGSSLVRPVLFAAVGAALVGELVGRFARATLGSTLIASIVGLVLAAPVAVSSTAPTPGAVRRALADLGDAPQRILSVPLPVRADPALVIVVFVAVWLAVAASVELARRTRSPFAPVLPSAVAVTGPVVLAAGGPVPSEGRWTLVLLLAAFVVAARSLAPRPDAIRSARSDRLLRRRRIVAGVPILAVVAVLAPSLAPRAPGIAERRRVELRDVVEAEPDQITSPLALVDVLAGEAGGKLAFRASGPSQPVRFHLATLDRYDGTSWSAPNGSVRVAERFPDYPDPLPGRSVTYDVEVGDTGTAFLPVPGRPSSLEGASVQLDTITGNVRLLSGSSDGLEYQVTGIVPDADPTVVNAAQRDVTGTDAATAAEDIANDDILSILATNRATAVQPQEAGLSTDMRFLKALQSYLSDPKVFGTAEKPKGGESLGHLATALAGSSAGDGKASKVRQASQQQFVAGFAVMARSLDFATRVAVGYVYNGTGDITFDTSDIRAWAEVKMEGVGWVPFDVGPDTDAAANDAPVPENEEDSSTATTTPPPPAEPDPDLDGEAAAAAGERPVWPIVAGVVAALVVAAALLRRPVRRLRRRRGDPRQQVVGAWAEAVDLLRRAGARTGAAQTVAEVSAGSGAALADPGRAALDQLGALVTRVSWSTAPVPDDAGTTAWAQVAEVRRHRTRRADRRRSRGADR